MAGGRNYDDAVPYPFDQTTRFGEVDVLFDNATLA